MGVEAGNYQDKSQGRSDGLGYKIWVQNWAIKSLCKMGLQNWATKTTLVFFQASEDT